MVGGATIEITPESAVLHTTNHHLAWHQRKRAFQVMKDAVGARHLSAIKRSSDQGRAFDSLSLHPDSTFFTYTGAFLSFYQYRFTHKARLNLLPVRTVQARCHRPVPTTLCRRCGKEQETLAHVLNHCHYNLVMARDRHNFILERIVRAVPAHLGTMMKEQPLPGTSEANRPDLTIISPDESSVIIVEVCCPFEGSPQIHRCTNAHDIRSGHTHTHTHTHTHQTYTFQFMHTVVLLSTSQKTHDQIPKHHQHEGHANFRGGGRREYNELFTRGGD